MNTRPTDDDIAEREWQLQERALRDEREGAAAAGDAGIDEYRRIARALRTPPAMRLPSNFAYQVAQLAARMPRASRLDLRLERWLVRALVAAMALGGVASAAVYGRDWLSALEQGAGSGAGGWMLAAAACLLLTWGMDGLRRWRIGYRRS